MAQEKRETKENEQQKKKKSEYIYTQAALSYQTGNCQYIRLDEDKSYLSYRKYQSSMALALSFDTFACSICSSKCLFSIQNHQFQRQKKQVSFIG